MFSFKKRAATLKKLNKFTSIHSFDQQRAIFKNALSLTLRKSKPCCATPLKNGKSPVRPSEKTDLLEELACASANKHKKLSFQKLLENRKLLNERGRKINDMQGKHRLTLPQELQGQRPKENAEYLWRNAGAVRLKIGRNVFKTDISCRGLSFQINELPNDERTHQVRRVRRERHDYARMTEPFGQFQRIATMPDFKEDSEIKLSPWE